MSLSNGISTVRQAFPGKPKFTEKDVPDLAGKIIIVTGSNTGIGKETAQILYSKHAKVYMLARSEDKTRAAMDAIRAAHPSSRGELVFLRLDLADLHSVKACAEEFLRGESRLHILFNNAGVAFPGKGSKTAQGFELQLGVNCVGTWALTKLLTPTLVATASDETPGSVRVVWVSSSAVEAATPRNFVENLSKDKSGMGEYAVSKLGNYLHGAEFAARYRADGVVSVSLNPGNLDSDLWRTQGAVMTWLLKSFIFYPVVNGAYTLLWSGLSPEVTLEKSGSFIAPWGRLWNVSKDMTDAAKTKAQGGTGAAKEFWEWTEAQVNNHI